MDKLTDHVENFKTFHKCQFCGYSSDDICEFDKWNECDDNDVPTEQFLIVCRHNKECRRKIEVHPRLYIKAEWGTGTPGNFILLCGSCKFRKGHQCSHPDLKKNGGEGLEISFSKGMMQNIRVCFSDGTSFVGLPAPASICKGQEIIDIKASEP